MKKEHSGCRKPTEHAEHLCALRSRLDKPDLAALQKNPGYVCGICRGKTRSGKNLCDPRRIRR